MAKKKAIQKVLIANRGEIVSRIIKTCRALDIETVAVYSEADKDAAYVRQSKEAFPIGPANPMKSYLNMKALIEAAEKSGADAVHPGYGFLSENGDFADAVTSNGMIWIGPSSEVLRAVESKSYCRGLAHENGVPVNPGTLSPIRNVEEISQFGAKHGYPIFLKLDKGGGGKGIEIIQDASQIQEGYERISRIGLAAFNSSDCYIEKLLPNPRHIEVQFLRDDHDTCVCLSERECSIQRRHQKIIEESPSPSVTEEDRETLFHHTVKLAGAMGYQGAGTMEFLRSEKGEYSFMEINARLQVEHPVTEMVTGVDMVRCQFHIASGEKLEFGQDEIKIEGHSIEARVYAEDPYTFQPSPGTIKGLHLPPETEHVRVDHALKKNVSVPPFYDPLLAKVIVWDKTRLEAADRLRQALLAFHIDGVNSTIPLNLDILENRSFLNGDYDTSFVEKLFS